MQPEEISMKAPQSAGFRKASPYKKALILHAYKVFYPDVFGGIPYIILQAAEVTTNSISHQILVCSKTASEVDLKNIKVKRVKKYGSLLSMPIAPAYIPELWRQTRNSDLLILHWPFPLADLGVILLGRKSIPFIIYWHSDTVNQRIAGLLLRPLRNWLLKKATFILVSDASVLSKVRFSDSIMKKVRTVPFPVDVSRFELDRDEKLKVQNIKKQYPRLVLSVGRLVSYKGFDVLIRAANLIDGKVIIVGEGIEREKLQGLINRLKLNDKITLVGALPEREMICYFRSASLFVLPSNSRAETFGIVQIEAMAAGLLIVNTNLETAVPFVARNGIEAITVPPNDYMALASAINSLLNNPHKCQELAINSAIRVREFSPDKYHKELISIYEQALSMKSDLI